MEDNLVSLSNSLRRRTWRILRWQQVEDTNKKLHRAHVNRIMSPNSCHLSPYWRKPRQRFSQYCWHEAAAGAVHAPSQYNSKYSSSLYSRSWKTLQNCSAKTGRVNCIRHRTGLREAVSFEKERVCRLQASPGRNHCCESRQTNLKNIRCMTGSQHMRADSATINYLYKSFIIVMLFTSILSSLLSLTTARGS